MFFSKVPNFWKSKNYFMTLILYPFSIVYFLLIILNKTRQKILQKKIDIKIICVGNIYIGGTGKTPLAKKIYENIKEKRKCCLIKKFRNNHLDEINMLKLDTEIFTPKERVEGLLNAKKKGYEVAVLDDGMQDYSFKKDISILCIKSNDAFGNENILPVGPLREPMNSIRKYNIAIINGDKNTYIEDKLKYHNSKISIYYSHYTIMPKTEYLDQKFLAFSGIANNDDFFELMIKNNIKVIEKKSFPDHHIFTNSDLENLKKISVQKKLLLATTEKNYYGIDKKFRENILCVNVKLEIENLNKLLNEIN